MRNTKYLLPIPMNYLLCYDGQIFGFTMTLSIIFNSSKLGASCHWLLFNAMVGDITDEDELKTHQRREGAFFGVNRTLYILLNIPNQVFRG